MRRLLYACPLIEAPVGTLCCTEHGTIMVDLRFIVRVLDGRFDNAGLLAGVPKVAWCIAHELFHLIHRHIQRTRAAGRLDLDRANAADDLAMYDELCALGFAAPDGVLTPAKYGFPPRLTSAMYYAMLPESPPSKGGSGDGEGEGGSGVGSGKCGSCAGKRHAQEPAGAARTANAARVERAVHGACEEIAKAPPGSVPDSLKRSADELLAPKRVDWKTLARTAMRRILQWQAGAVTTRYDAPSRRQGGLGWGAGVPIFGRWREPRLEVAVVIDASGSMGRSDLSTATSETVHLASTLGCKVTLVVCDAQASEPREVASLQEVLDSLTGGGGTDMRPAFAVLEKRAKRPTLTVVITDGDVGRGFPQEKPAWTEVLTIVTRPTRNDIPAWCTAICVPESQGSGYAAD